MHIVWTTLSIILAAEPTGGSPASGVVPTLLTGGGFAFLGIVMTGLFLWNKNKAESANTVAQGAATWAEGMSRELTAYKSWAGRRRTADHEHTAWDNDTYDQLRDLIRKCEEAKVIEAGSIILKRPPSLDVPFVDEFTDPHLPARK